MVNKYTPEIEEVQSHCKPSSHNHSMKSIDAKQKDVVLFQLQSFYQPFVDGP